jgi:hypothetical protein
LLFFTLRYIHPALDFPAIVVDRQLQFKVLKATSVFYIPTPEASFTGFVKFLPYAAKDVLFKPFPGEGGKLIFAVNTAEVFCFWGFFLFLLIRSRAHLRLKNIRPLYWSHFLYALANLIIVGYIVPNIGALVRYRSIFLPWLAIWLWYALDGESWLKSISSRSRLLSLSNL